MHISLIGTRGVPARYGGFETCVEEVGRRLVTSGHRVTVYCRTAGPSGGTGPGDRTASPVPVRPAEYLGMRLVQLPAVRHKVLETLSHTALSVGHAVSARPDVAFVFNAANAPFLPLLRMRRIPVATHVDGLEWKRAKWGRAGRRYYRLAESLAVRWSDALIADSTGIQQYYSDRFDTPSEYIPYGAPLLPDPGSDRLAELGLVTHGYHLVVARFEPENHLHIAVAGYLRSGAELPLVVVGAAPYADRYTAAVRDLAAGNPAVRFLGGVWDQQLLDQLYGNALTYVHGHSVGGTNPSLLRAMGASAATSAFDVPFNREVLGELGRYFTTPDELAALCAAAEADPDATVARGRAQPATLGRYDWDRVAEDYQRLALRLAAGTPTSNRSDARGRT